MTTKEIVGPVRFQYFGLNREVRIPYTPPRNTMDPRWDACVAHRVACDCREAEHAEHIQELAGQLRAWEKAALGALAGHRTFHWGHDDEHGSRGDGPLACQCSGCHLVRAAYPSGIGLDLDYDTGQIGARP